MSVPFDLVKKHPKGQQTFSLMTKDIVTGSLTTDVRPFIPVNIGMLSYMFVFDINRYSLLLFHISEVITYTKLEY